MFDHEKLDVYQLSLRFVSWVSVLFDDLTQKQCRRVSEVCDHLDRASLSILFNTAEGNGKRQRQTRAKFFDDARGSTTECAACLDALIAKRACEAERVVEGKNMLVRVYSMLTKLVQRFSETGLLHEEQTEYRITTSPAESPLRGRRRGRPRGTND